MCVCVIDNITGMCHFKSNEVYTQHQSLLNIPQLHFWIHGYMSCFESTLKKWRCKVVVIASIPVTDKFSFLDDWYQLLITLDMSWIPTEKHVFTIVYSWRFSVFQGDEMNVLSRIVCNPHGTHTIRKMGIRKGREEYISEK